MYDGKNINVVDIITHDTDGWLLLLLQRWREHDVLETTAADRGDVIGDWLNKLKRYSHINPHVASLQRFGWFNKVCIILNNDVFYTLSDKSFHHTYKGVVKAFKSCHTTC